jgi:hypothetical protein
MTSIPRDKYIGKRVGDPLADEAEHFIKCASCGGWIDPCHTRHRTSRND